jgi:hypothetical protein
MVEDNKKSNNPTAVKNQAANFELPKEISPSNWKMSTDPQKMEANARQFCDEFATMAKEMDSNKNSQLQSGVANFQKHYNALVNKSGDGEVTLEHPQSFLQLVKNVASAHYGEGFFESIKFYEESFNNIDDVAKDVVQKVEDYSYGPNIELISDMQSAFPIFDEDDEPAIFSEQPSEHDGLINLNDNTFFGHNHEKEIVSRLQSDENASENLISDPNKDSALSTTRYEPRKVFPLYTYAKDGKTPPLTSKQRLAASQYENDFTRNVTKAQGVVLTSTNTDFVVPEAIEVGLGEYSGEISIPLFQDKKTTYETSTTISDSLKKTTTPYKNIERINKEKHRYVLLGSRDRYGVIRGFVISKDAGDRTPVDSLQKGDQYEMHYEQLKNVDPQRDAQLFKQIPINLAFVVAKMMDTQLSAEETVVIDEALTKLLEGQYKVFDAALGQFMNGKQWSKNEEKWEEMDKRLASYEDAGLVNVGIVRKQLEEKLQEQITQQYLTPPSEEETHKINFDNVLSEMKERNKEKKDKWDGNTKKKWEEVCAFSKHIAYVLAEGIASGDNIFISKNSLYQAIARKLGEKINILYEVSIQDESTKLSHGSNDYEGASLTELFGRLDAILDGKEGGKSSFREKVEEYEEQIKRREFDSAALPQAAKINDPFLPTSAKGTNYSTYFEGEKKENDHLSLKGLSEDNFEKKLAKQKEEANLGRGENTSPYSGSVALGYAPSSPVQKGVHGAESVDGADKKDDPLGEDQDSLEYLSELFIEEDDLVSVPSKSNSSGSSSSHADSSTPGHLEPEGEIKGGMGISDSPSPIQGEYELPTLKNIAALDKQKKRGSSRSASSVTSGEGTESDGLESVILSDTIGGANAHDPLSSGSTIMSSLASTGFRVRSSTTSSSIASSTENSLTLSTSAASQSSSTATEAPAVAAATSSAENPRRPSNRQPAEEEESKRPRFAEIEGAFSFLAWLIQMIIAAVSWVVKGSVTVGRAAVNGVRNAVSGERGAGEEAMRAGDKGREERGQERDDDGRSSRSGASSEYDLGATTGRGRSVSSASSTLSEITPSNTPPDSRRNSKLQGRD